MTNRRAQLRAICWCALVGLMWPVGANAQTPFTDSSTTSTWIFRDRWTVAYPLNRPKTTSDGAIYLTNDIEGFVPLDSGFINQLRTRTGVGYRPGFPWKFEWLYVWDGQRSSPSQSLSTSYNAFYFRVYYQF